MFFLYFDEPETFKMFFASLHIEMIPSSDFIHYSWSLSNASS